ncbi:hypothetical protein NQ315_016262 [Exocentrus adspersus]|uniref:DDE Tnp4 domain-containing protein n=1 Tax=Exocentrus adspersus TaxID=1586481 RepID=A0AAV8VDL3_9CUCU|nr:hypothetical protein NQ315_016262 [Exocentrus adspersus]
MQSFNDGDRSSWLLGDSGYPLEPWLMTPVVGNNLNEEERMFNLELRRIRNLVERGIGIFKSRFRCCFSHRALHYSPVKAAKIVSACAILHIILIEQRDILEDVDEPIIERNEPIHIDELNLGQNFLHEGRNYRKSLHLRKGIFQCMFIIY